ncbi:hypothetical protein Avbf_12471 [Armadillidium vulgare]|nr:hypothetical protein Avbf_12471 [Armadillidium vulgare]
MHIDIVYEISICISILFVKLNDGCHIYEKFKNIFTANVTKPSSRRAAADFARAAGYTFYGPYQAMGWPNAAVAAANPIWGSALPSGLPAAAYGSSAAAAQALSLHQAHQEKLHCQQLQASPTASIHDDIDYREIRDAPSGNSSVGDQRLSSPDPPSPVPMTTASSVRSQTSSSSVISSSSSPASSSHNSISRTNNNGSGTCNSTTTSSSNKDKITFSVESRLLSNSPPPPSSTSANHNIPTGPAHSIITSPNNPTGLIAAPITHDVTLPLISRALPGWRYQSRYHPFLQNLTR